MCSRLAGLLSGSPWPDETRQAVKRQAIGQKRLDCSRLDSYLHTNCRRLACKSALQLGPPLAHLATAELCFDTTSVTMATVGLVSVAPHGCTYTYKYVYGCHDVFYSLPLVHTGLIEPRCRGPTARCVCTCACAAHVTPSCARWRRATCAHQASAASQTVK